MKKLLFVVALLLAVFLAACGGSSPQSSSVTPAGETGGGAQNPIDTPTAVVLATPTSKPAPPTPTPRPTPTPAPTTAAEESKTEATPEAQPLNEDMVSVPAGPFTMGYDKSAKAKNKPAHQVDLPAFEIDRFELTNDEFAQFVAQTGYKTYAEQNGAKSWKDVIEGKGNHPVVYVTWDDATAYCKWAGKRLPTEAEWEKAARGDDARIYPWGNEFNAANGNFYEGGIRGTTAVGSFPSGASPYGAEDMSGNVREWVEDFFLPYPGAAADADPFFGEKNKVNRGGGWFDDEKSEVLTTYNRNAGPPGISANDDIGFRCARDAK